jgi:arylsulfatase
MKLAEPLTDVLVCGYRDIEAASRDFAALAQLVKGKQVQVEGVILVSRATDGSVNVMQTGDHLGRKGMAWGGGVGLAVGLAAPPLLAATAVGAAVGGLAGKFASHKLAQGIQEQIGANLPPGTAGIIAVYDSDQRLAIQQALGGALARSVVQSEKEGIGALKDSLAEAMGKFVPDRTVLPIPDRPFGGRIGTSGGCWTPSKRWATWTTR